MDKKKFMLLIIPAIFVLYAADPFSAETSDRCERLKMELTSLNADERFNILSRWGDKKMIPMKQEYDQAYLQIIRKHGLPAQHIEKKMGIIWKRILISYSLILMVPPPPFPWYSYKEALYKLALQNC